MALALGFGACEVNTKTRREGLECENLGVNRGDIIAFVFHVYIIPDGWAPVNIYFEVFCGCKSLCTIDLGARGGPAESGFKARTRHFQAILSVQASKMGRHHEVVMPPQT